MNLFLVFNKYLNKSRWQACFVHICSVEPFGTMQADWLSSCLIARGRSLVMRNLTLLHCFAVICCVLFAVCALYITLSRACSQVWARVRAKWNSVCVCVCVSVICWQTGLCVLPCMFNYWHCCQFVWLNLQIDTDLQWRQTQILLKVLAEALPASGSLPKSFVLHRKSSMTKCIC